MPRPERADLAAYAGATVDDLVPTTMRLLFVGINPGLWTAATNTHFAYPSNRFYPALVAAGLSPPFADPASGLEASELDALQAKGIGMTNIVARATARADELAPAEIRAGGVILVERIRVWRPAVVAVLGLTAYRTAFRRPQAQRGEQAGGLGGARTFVFGNPSGLNAHETIDTLAAGFREAATAAGLVPP